MKKYFLLLAMALVAMVSCESVETPAGPCELKLISSAVMDFTADGGQGVIDYTLTGVKEGELPTAESGADWITNITVADKITFDIALNEVTEQRTATIYVEYGEQNFSVQIVQAAAGPKPDIYFEATALNGESYGDKYTNGKSYDYYAILSKNGTTGYMDLYLDTYYRFDIYSDTPPSEPLTLPVGVYEFDDYDLSTPGTFGSGYSFRFQTFEDGTYKENRVLDGKIVVTENHIEALVKYDDGKLHKITYDGSLELSYIQIPNDPPYSRLTKDYTFENSGVMRMLYYGDTYGLGGANWLVEVMDNTEKMNGDYFRVNLVANDNTYSADSVWGTYTAVATEDEVAKGTFVAGTEAGVNEYYHSWYWVIEDNLVNHDYGAPLSTGSVNIAKEGSSYIMTIDCMDDNGHKIQGTYTCGGIEVYDMTTM